MAQMLAQCGMYAPAASARLGHATGMFVSLVEGARVDSEEGRLGTEMLRCPYSLMNVARSSSDFYSAKVASLMSMGRLSPATIRTPSLPWSEQAILLGVEP